jgi:TolA-binding protein
MSEERPTTRHGFFSRVFSGGAGEDETAVYSAEEVGVSERGMHSFTVERAAEVIRNLPPEVPRPAAVRIVRQTLEAAGIDIAELSTSTAERETKLNSEIEASQGRIQEIKDRTETAIRSYEEEIRKAQEARDLGISEQERRISGARTGLEDVERVRDFFGLSREEAATTTGDVVGDETQVMERADEDDTQILRHPGPLSEEYWDTRENRDR